MVDFTVNSYRPGNMSGPPEECYEAEGDLVIDALYLNGDEIDSIGDDDDLENIIWDECWLKYANSLEN
jgi:hypothetical protein